MKKTLLLLVVMSGFCLACNAQSSLGSPQNTDYIEKYDGVRGYFNHAVSGTETMVVSFSFTPGHPKDKAVLYLQTPSAMPLWATVTDKSGKIVRTWKPANPNYQYAADLNFAKLKSGTYDVHISMGTSENIHSFSVTKE